MQTNTLKVGDKIKYNYYDTGTPKGIYTGIIKEIRNLPSLFKFKVLNEGSGKDHLVYEYEIIEVIKDVPEYKIGDKIKYHYKDEGAGYPKGIYTGVITQVKSVIFDVKNDIYGHKYLVFDNEVIEVIKDAPNFATKPPAAKFNKGDKVTTTLQFNDSEFEVVDSEYDQKYNAIYYTLRGTRSGLEYEIAESELKAAPKFTQKYKVGDIVEINNFPKTNRGIITEIIRDCSIPFYTVKVRDLHYSLPESQIIGLANTDTTTKRHALYSAQADELFGHCIYLSVDGEEVKVTNVSEDLVGMVRGYLWKDAVYVGQVTKCLKVNKGGRIF